MDEFDPQVQAQIDAAVAWQVQAALHTADPHKHTAPGGIVEIERVEAWVHCPSPDCPSMNAQSRVEALAETLNVRFMDEDPGTSINRTMTSRSFTKLRFAREEDKPCPSCGWKCRELTMQQRPNYAPLSGYDPTQLLRLKQGWTKGDLHPPGHYDELVRRQGSDFRSISPDPAPPAVTDTDEFRQAVADAVAVALAERENGADPPVEPSVPGNGPDRPPDPPEGSATAEPSAPTGDATARRDPDPPTRDDSWATIEPHIHHRTRKDGSETFRVKIAGQLVSGIGTLEEARTVRDELRGMTS